MALAIATNNAALNAAASASSVNRDMETSMARLSTGKRINSASDDAAGVAISSRLSAEIRGTDQAIRNSLDGQALIDTAEGAHKEIENILQRMREVAVQAANDTNNGQDRGNLAAEMTAMVSEIDRISDTTTWAGADLMMDEKTSFSFQVGAATGEPNQIKISIDSMGAEALGIGTSTPEDVKTRNDEIAAYKVLTDAVVTKDKELVDAGTAKTNAVNAAKDSTGADITGLAVALDAAIGGDGSSVTDALAALSNMTGHVATRSATDVHTEAAGLVTAGTDLDGDDTVGDLDTAIKALAAGTTETASQSDLETAVSDAIGAVQAVVGLTGVGGVKSEADAASATSDAAKLLTDAVVDAGADVTTADDEAVAAAKAVKDGTDPGAALSPTGLEVDSGDNARLSITAIDSAILKVNDQRSALGAVSNRLNHTVNNLTNISSNLSAAKGGIEDADFALETTNLAKNQILQQASTAMLAQANASKQNVLSLLQG